MEERSLENVASEAGKTLASIVDHFDFVDFLSYQEDRSYQLSLSELCEVVEGRDKQSTEGG